MLVVLGIILLAVGAIITFAIDTAVDGIDLVSIGYILMAAGAVSLMTAAIKGAGWATMGNSKMRSERHVSPDGRSVVEETEIR